MSTLRKHAKALGVHVTEFAEVTMPARGGSSSRRDGSHSGLLLTPVALLGNVVELGAPGGSEASYSVPVAAKVRAA